jgi:hypothetical protein
MMMFPSDGNKKVFNSSHIFSRANKLVGNCHYKLTVAVTLAAFFSEDHDFFLFSSFFLLCCLQREKKTSQMSLYHSNTMNVRKKERKGT